MAVDRQARRDDQAVELVKVGLVQIGDLGSRRRLRPRLFFGIPAGDTRAAGKQSLRGRQSRSGETVNCVFLSGESLGGDHLSLRVLRPASASTKLMIQKRMTTVGSDQPRCSKWWWIGAIRKTRFPVRL